MPSAASTAEIFFTSALLWTLFCSTSKYFKLFHHDLQLTSQNNFTPYFPYELHTGKLPGLLFSLGHIKSQGFHDVSSNISASFLFLSALVSLITDDGFCFKQLLLFSLSVVLLVVWYIAVIQAIICLINWKQEAEEMLRLYGNNLYSSTNMSRTML